MTQQYLSNYEPSWREYLQGLAMEGVGMLGAGTDTQRRAYRDAGKILDIIPGVGDATAANEAYRDFRVGNYGDAAIGGASAAIGLIPGIGDASGQAVKQLQNLLGPTGIPYVAKSVPGDLPIHPDVMRGVDQPYIPGLSLNVTPLERMYHGTNTRSAYDQPHGGLYDEGLHLTRSPGVAAFYSTNLTSKNPELIDQVARGEVPASVLAGPRTYPMLVDPGNVYRGLIDPNKWNNPQDVADIFGDYYADFDEDYLLQAFPEFKDWPAIYDDMLMKRTPVIEAFKKRGYDSIEYSHIDPFMDDEYAREPTGHALMLFDATRAVPEYSAAGQKAGRVRGILAPNDIYDNSLDEAYGPEGFMNPTRLTPEALLEWTYDPRSIDPRDITKQVPHSWEKWSTIP